MTKEEKLKKRKQDRISQRNWLNQIKSVPCMDCKNTFDPVCMDFDHRPGEEKSFSIGWWANGMNRESLLKEIAKCDIVCSNCHRLRTKNRRESK